MPFFDRSRVLSSLLVATLASAPFSARAQAAAAQRAPNPTRAELEATAAQLDSQASSSKLTKEEKQSRLAEAASIRQRLVEGDFSPCDRIVVTLQGDSARTDTLVVRAGRRLVFRALPEVSIDGVLRSELKDRLTQHVGRFLRNPQLIVTPLVRISVLGEVLRPGYYPISGDLLLSDAIMAAGGPNQTADLARTVVMRGGAKLMSDKDVRSAVQAGRTIDQLNLHEGDEIVVGKHPQRNWNLLIAFTTAGVALLSAMSALHR